MNCSRCDVEVPQARIDMGYTICTDCSTEEKVSCHTIYPHKTGGYIQVVSKQESENLNRLDRRGTSKKTAKHYKEFNIEPMQEPKQYKSRPCTKEYTSYTDALEMVNKYYDEWGYKPTIKYLKQISFESYLVLLYQYICQNQSSSEDLLLLVYLNLYH